MQLLKAECFACHNQEKKKGGLVLSTRERLLEGGDSGAAVVPGKPKDSLLARVLAREADPHMPPRKQLAEAQIRVLRDWIRAGVPWDEAAWVEEEPVRPVTLAALPASYQPLLALALSPDGARLASGQGGAVLVRDAARTNFPLVSRREADRDAVQSLAWSSDGRWLVAGGFRQARWWAADDGPSRGEWTNGLAGRLTAVRFVPGDERVVVADSLPGQAGYIRVLERGQPGVVKSWRAHEDTVYALDVSRDGRRLVTAGGDRRIRVWDLVTGREVAALEGHTAAVLAVAFNSNATQVVSGGADKQAKVWDIDTRHVASNLGKPSAAVTAVLWTGDGQALYVATDNGAVFRYTNLKAHTGRESSEAADERRLAETGEPVTSLGADAAGRLVVAGSFPGVLRAWTPEAKEVPIPLLPVSPALTVSPAPAPPAASRAAKDPAGASLRPARVPGQVVALRVDPAALELSLDAPRHGVLVSARTADGFEVDVTGRATLSAGRGEPFEVLASGEVRARRAGQGMLTVRFEGRRVQVPVTVRGGGGGGAAFGEPQVSFVRDVLPVLSRAGCNAGACHAKAEGQNGFRLTVFSYDPRSDYEELVREQRGRRVFPAAPDESLLLRKPLGTLPHEGGVRFEAGSEAHQLLARWIRQGMPYMLTNEPVLQRIVVLPREQRPAKEGRQRLLVQAHYADGGVRDVTRLAAFASSDKEFATVDEHGTVTVGSLTGQGVVVARYLGFVADSQILVPSDRRLPASVQAGLPRHNFIDDLALAHFQQLGLEPSALCSDAEFLRRARLDTLGLLPAPEEVRAFLADSAPDKRRRLIDQLLADPAYADHWANQWADLLRPNPDRAGVKSVFLLDQWLREQFRRNRPYDQFVRDILMAEGSTHREGPAVIYRDRREPADLTTMFSQLFLGTRLECARCHHHPNEKWGQEDFYQFAAFFGSLRQKGAGLSPPISGGFETFYHAPGGKGVQHPVTGLAMAPRALDGPAAGAGEGSDPRRALADWLTRPDNPFFARAAVNRAWAAFFGRGLVDPVDDFRISNPCVNPPLLQALADDFARHGYDWKHLLRTILESRLYQLATAPNASNVGDTRQFSRAYRRRLPAEVLLDAVNAATGVPDTFSGLPPGSRASQAWTYKMDSQLMDAFSRPNPSSDPPCERDRQMSVVQSLHLMNSKALQAKLSHPQGRARRLADSDRAPADIVTELYLATLSRFPTAEESRTAAAAFSAPAATRQGATEDILWALLNSPEFVFNH